MLGLYYRIWVDLITRARSKPENEGSWAWRSMAFMSISMTLNLVLFMTFLQKFYLEFYFYSFDLDFLPKYFSNVVSFVVLFVLPCVLMNYFLIFRNNRYEGLVKKYPSSPNSNLFLVYFLISMLLPLVLLFGGIIVGKIGVSKM
jgi:hypothetical protein